MKTITTAGIFCLSAGACNYPIALEGALKLKEISYIHAEGYASGELKHGPIALIDKDMPMLALVPQDEVYQKSISNVEEIKARQGTNYSYRHRRGYPSVKP